MASSTLSFINKNNIFRKIYLLLILLFVSLFMMMLFGKSIVVGNNRDEYLEGLVNYGSVSVPDSRAAVEDVLNSNNSSIVKVLNIKNIILDTKVGTKENLTKADTLYYDQITNIFNVINDSTISAEKQLFDIQLIMKEVNPTLKYSEKKEDK